MKAVTLISAIFCVGLAMFPSSISADSISVQTQQIAPAGNNICTSLSAYSFVPYVYDGSLHSFSFTVPDSSYVAIAGSVGESPIPFQLMTRQGTENNLQVHVDIETTPISGSLPVSVTLMSAKGGQAICMSVVLIQVSEPTGEVVTVPEPETTAPPLITIPPITPPVVIGEQPEEEGEIGTGTTSPEVIGEEEGSKVPFTIAGLQNKLVELCLAGSAPRLWILLVAVYAVIVIVAVFTQLPSPQTYSVGQRTATVIVPFALLAAFWFFSEACRTGLWAPITSIVLALAGLVGIYWNDPRITKYTTKITGFFVKTETQKKLPIPSSKAIVTPPPTKKPGA